MSNPLLQCIDLNKSYQEGTQHLKVLRHVNFAMNEGEMLSIMGSSGSGKSTFLHLLAGLDEPTSGDILFKGQSIKHLSENRKARFRNKEIGFIYQFHHLLPDFTALENIAMPLLINEVPIKDAKEKAFEMLEAIGLEDRALYHPSKLSGGERQRVAIGRALINSPSIVMADEPTGNLDRKNAENVFDLLLDLNQRNGTAFLVVTHDMSLAKRLNRQLEMRDGKLIESEQE